MPEVQNADSVADEAQQRAAEENSHSGDGIPVQPMELVGVPANVEPNRVVIDSEEFSASSTLNELRRSLICLMRVGPQPASLPEELMTSMCELFQMVMQQMLRSPQCRWISFTQIVLTEKLQFQILKIKSGRC